MFSSKNENRYEMNLNNAYFNMLKRKDGKYNFVFLPYVSVAEEEYQHLYIYSKSSEYNKGIIIKYISINNVVIKYNLNEQIQLSLKPGKYKLKVLIDIELYLLINVIEKVKKINPNVNYHSYKDLYRCEVEKECDFVVNDKDIAYVLFKGKITPQYTRSKNLFFMESYSHSYEMRQTSIEHIKSMIPNVKVFDDLRYEYKEVDQLYIDDVNKMYGEDLKKYKDVEPKVITTSKPNTVDNTEQTPKIEDGFRIINYNNGSKYVGNVKNGVPNGIGTYYYHTGETYSGNFVDGKVDGNGTIKYTDNSSYIGSFKNNRKHGKGKLYKPDGSIILYEFDNGVSISQKQEEKVTMSTTATNIGKKEIKQLDNYYGQVKNGKRDGFGLSFVTNWVFAGVYNDDQVDGPIIQFMDDKVYFGLKLANSKNKFCCNIARGKFSFADNFPYVAFSKKVLEKPTRTPIVPTNTSKLYELDNFNYVGVCSSISSEGVGIRYNVDGKTHFGELKNGKVNGYGMVYDEKDLYIGEFKDGVLHGIGMIVSNYKRDSYTTTIAKWSNGKFESDVTISKF